MAIDKPQISFNLIPEKQVEAAIANDYTRIDWTGRSTKNIAKATGQIRESIAQGIREGKDYSQMANAVSDRMGKSANDMRRIARTEGHRCRVQGNLDSLKFAHEKGLNLEKEWIAALDDRTRDAHAILDGTSIGVNEDFVSQAGGRGQGPGLMGTAADDIECRCDLTGNTPGEKFEYRGYRYDDAPGSYIGKYSNYMNWAEKKGIKPHLFTDDGLGAKLSKLENELRKRTTEKAYVLDEKGNVVLSKEGAYDRVVFTKEEAEKFRNNIFTHNHPKVSSFSNNDIELAVNYNMKEIRVVGDGYVHIIERPADGWSHWRREAITNAKTGKRTYLDVHISDKSNEIYNRNLKLINEGFIDPKMADMAHWRVVWEELSEELGFKFIRREF